MKKIMLIILFVGGVGFASQECERMLSHLGGKWNVAIVKGSRGLTTPDFDTSALS